MAAMSPVASLLERVTWWYQTRTRNDEEPRDSARIPGLPLPMPSHFLRAGAAWPLVMVLLQLGLNVATAQGVGPAPQPALPVSAEEPIFRLEAGGPSSLVTGLAFAPDGQTLYVAGWDKIVRVWALDRAKGEFQLDRPATFRVPIGPGLDGAINSLAVSSDAKGEWLAVAGQGLMRAWRRDFANRAFSCRSR